MPGSELVRLEWITPDAERRIVEMARVSADPSKEPRPDHVLIGYLIRNAHWSPFEMANICFRVRTSRAIGRQLLRHRSMAFQEFSQRYADAELAGEPIYTECRMQHPTNRQSSVPVCSSNMIHDWITAQSVTWGVALNEYRMAIASGIAKEVARAILPEGMTPTVIYANAPIRAALHFCQLRRGNGTQKEMTAIADALWSILQENLPATCQAFEAAQ